MFEKPFSIKNKNKKVSPYTDFKQDDYDKRSSCFVNVGVKHGSGKPQPIGNMGKPKREVPALPKNGVHVIDLKVE